MMKEDQNTEWKLSWRDEYLKWICGFANAEGGVLVIGRDDRGEAVGVKNAGKLLQELPNKVRDILGITVAVNLMTEEEKELIEIHVEPYPSPISYKGEYHYRSGSTKQELKGAALQRFLLRKLGRHWDDAPVPGNSGQLPDDWTIERLLGKHPSNPYNPLIAGAFFRAGYIESWGRGIEKINRECREHDIPSPEFDYGMSGLMLTFRANPAHLRHVGDRLDKKVSESGFDPTITPTTTPKTTQETTQEKIISILKTRPASTRNELAAQIGITPDGVKYHLEKLKAAGIICHVGPTKTGYWEVRKMRVENDERGK